MTLQECLFGKTIDLCTWIQHSAIAITGVVLAQAIIPGVEFYAAVVAAAAFIYRETQGPDRHIPWYRRLIATPDRIGDWVSPSVSAALAATILHLWG